MNEEYLKVVTQAGRPIPGQSLTENPDNPAPYEKPPEFTSVHKASEFIFSKLIEEETYIQMMKLLSDDMPVMDIVRTLLFKGFTEGKWTPDLMLMLAEPVAYMLLALAERAGIEPIIYREEDEDEDEEEIVLGAKFEKQKLERMKKFMSTGKAPAQTLTPEMIQQIEQLPESLMSEKPQAPSATGSLLSAPEVSTEEEMQ